MRRRQKKGQSLIEVTLSLVLLVPMLLLLTDITIILHAIHFNDRTCYEAARTASMGEPRATLLRAAQVVASENPASSTPYSVDLVTAGSSVTKQQIDAMLPYGGQIDGTVLVITRIQVKTFIIGKLIGQERLSFLSTQELPATLEIPAMSAWH